MMEPARFSRLFDALAPALVLYARQWLESESARDAVQEAFVRLMQQAVEPDHPKAWLCRTIRNAALDQHRSHRRRTQREQAAAAPEAWFDPGVQALADAAAVQAGLAALTPEQREVIVLRIWNDLGWADIAQLVHAPVSTVFSRYRAGLAAMRSRLEERTKVEESKVESRKSKSPE